MMVACSFQGDMEALLSSGEMTPYLLGYTLPEYSLVKLSWNRGSEEEGHGSNATDSHCPYKVLVDFLA